MEIFEVIKNFWCTEISQDNCQTLIYSTQNRTTVNAKYKGGAIKC